LQPAGGGTLDHLDSMLSEDSGEGVQDLSGVATDTEELTAPEDIPPAPVAGEDLSGSLVLPEDAGEAPPVEEPEIVDSYEEPPQPPPGPPIDAIPPEPGEYSAGLDVETPVEEPAGQEFVEPAPTEETCEMQEPEVPSPPSAEEYEPPAPPAEAPAGGGMIIHIDQKDFTCRVGETITLRARVTDESGSPATAHEAVRFTINENIGPGADSQLQMPDSGQGGRELELRPDISGEVTVKIVASRTCGSFSVGVSTGDAAETVNVNVAPSEIEAIVIETAQAEVNPGDTIEITARALDAFENPVPGEFLAVSIGEYTGTAGVLAEQQENITNEMGEVKVMYTASPNPGNSITITASNPNVAPSAVRPLMLTTSGDVARPPEPAMAGAPQGPPSMAGEQLQAAPPPPPPPAGEQYETPQAPPPQAAPPPPPPGAPAGGDQMYAQENASAPPPPPAGAEQYQQPAPPPVQGQPVPAPPPPPAGAGDMSAPTPPSIDEAYAMPAGDEVDAMFSEAGYPEEALPELFEYEDGDPYAPPRFNIEKSRKPGVQMDSVLPRVIKFVVIGIVLAGILVGVLLGYKTAMYQYYVRRGIDAYNNNRYADAMMSLEKAHSYDETKIRPLQNLTVIHIENAEKAAKTDSLEKATNEIAMAINYLNKILSLDPNNIDALYNLGDAFEFKKDYCNSYKQYERILKIDPGYEAAKAKGNQMKNKCEMQQGLGGIRGRRY